MKRLAGHRIDGRRAAHGGAIVLAALLALLVLGLLANTLLLVTTASAATERHAVAGADVAIYNLAGRLHVEGGTGSKVVVEIERVGRDAGRLEVRTGPVRGRETLRILYPDDRIVVPGLTWGGTDHLRVRSDGTFGDGHDGLGFTGRRVTLRGRGPGLHAAANLRVTVPRGQRVRFHWGAGEIALANVDGEIVVDASSSHVKADGVRGALVVDTGSGQVDLANVEGALSVDTGSGDVTIAGMRGDALDVDTGSGGIDGTDIEAPRISCDTGSGDIRLDGLVASTISCDTGSGSVAVTLRSDVEALAVDTGSGSVTLRIPETLGARVSVETGSGGVHSNLPMRMLRHRSDALSGTLGDGRGVISVETGSGSVRILKL